MTLALASEEMSIYQLQIAIFSLIAKVVKKSHFLHHVAVPHFGSNWDNAKI